VRAIAAGWLRDHRARLDETKREDLVFFLLAECWRISGLAGDGRTIRDDAFEYFATVEISFASPRWSSLTGVTSCGLETIGPFTGSDDARLAGEIAAAEAELVGDTATVEILEQRARGIYDPNRGLAFSTFSHRILSLRVVDWYRDTFGDSRYESHQLEVSLESLARQENETVEGLLDRLMPGAVGHHLDEVNVHVYDNVGSDRAETGAVAR